MDDAGTVGRIERIGYLDGAGQRFVRRKRAAGEPIGQRAAGSVFRWE